MGQEEIFNIFHEKNVSFLLKPWIYLFLTQTGVFNYEDLYNLQMNATVFRP